MNEELELLDVITIISFIIQIQNYNENLSQSDKADLMNALDKQTKELLGNIHDDIEEQNKKLDEILERLKEINGH